MSRGRGLSVVPVLILLTLMVVVVPVSAYSVAIYGTNTGFNPSFHAGTVTVVRSIPGSTGADLDANVDAFTQDSVDVMILGGESTFSPSTAAKIEAAVAGGKILVLAYPCNQRFDKSLPATNGGVTSAGQYLEITNPDSVVAKDVFGTLPTRYYLQGKTTPEKEQAVARGGSFSVLDFDDGTPALLFGKYGKGMVIEWTTIPVPSYMDAQIADTVIHRLITGLLPVPGTTVPTTVTTRVTTTQTPAVNLTLPLTTIPSVTGTFPPGEETGSVTVYSSPSGASILIDGVYAGTTPKTVTGVPQGNHILRLTLSGYDDYEGSIYIVPGETTQGYGTLQPRTQLTTTPTAVPTVIVPIIVPATTPVPTTDQGLLSNSSVVVAIIGVITAIIAAAASIFTHVRPPKKE